MIIFGTPSDAVQFALLLQARLRKLKEQSQSAVVDRIGIHVGEVVMGAEKKLGEGGFGEVWRGQHQTSGTAPRDPSQKERGWVDRVPLETRLEIVAQAAEGLQAAHDAGVIHRDVKPSNILVSGTLECGGLTPLSMVAAAGSVDRGRGAGDSRMVEKIQSAVKPAHSKVQVKLTDFGIGQIVSEELLKGITRAGFTQTMIGASSSQTGTQLYMAPELLAGKPASIRSDIYSLGVVLYQLLVGDFTRPVTTDWANHISDPLLRDDVQHCFAGNPNDRFAGAGLLAKNLRALPQRQRAVAEQQAELAAKERAAYRRGVIRTAVLATFIAGAFAALAIYSFLIARQAARQHLRAERQRQRAQRGELSALRNAYAADMTLASLALYGMPTAARPSRGSRIRWQAIVRFHPITNFSSSLAILVLSRFSKSVAPGNRLWLGT